jgi:Tfp pilus assembly protein PilO
MKRDTSLSSSIPLRAIGTSMRRDSSSSFDQEEVSMIDPKGQIKRKRIVMLSTVVGIVLFSWALYAFLYSPKLGELKRMRDEISLKQEKISYEVNKQSSAIGVTRDELEKWESKIQDLNLRLPDREDFEYLLYDIGKMARSMGLRDFRLKVETDDEEEERKNTTGDASRQISVGKRKSGGDRKKKNEVALPVNAAVLKLDFTSRYREMARFLEGLTKNVRAMSIDEIKVGRSGDRMVAQITINAYYRENNEKAGW